MIEPAYILSISDESLSVLVPRFGIEGSISLMQEQASATSIPLLKGKPLKPTKKYNYNIQSIDYNAPQHSITLVLPTTTAASGVHKTKSLTLQVFQQVQVRLLTIEKSSGYRVLSIELVHPDIPAVGSDTPMITPKELMNITPSKRPVQNEVIPPVHTNNTSTNNNTSANKGNKKLKR